ncbi:hypothetical protein CMV_003352 [Castanea mollissima]|uniref:50S ribosomal protein L33, chloroplastic n=1 Tax=Castanea mollissima TaxID=60419 RepID=A0A8J4RTH6_9ROSI|nr:hypothetical protein CMV_003352 [Castanea mollissima]
MPHKRTLLFSHDTQLVPLISTHCYSRRRRQSPLGMGNKKKAAATFIRLVSTAGTGFFYVKRKPTKMTEKLEFRKYDPRVNRHVLFKEAKMK